MDHGQIIVILTHFLSYTVVFSVCYYFLNIHFSGKKLFTKNFALASIIYSLFSFAYLAFFFSEGHGLLNIFIPIVFLFAWALNKTQLGKKNSPEGMYAAVIPTTLFFIVFRNITNSTGFFRMDNAFTLVGVVAALLLFVAQYVLIRRYTKKHPAKTPKKTALYYTLLITALYIGLGLLKEYSGFTELMDFMANKQQFELLRMALWLISLYFFFYLNSLAIHKLYKYDKQTSRKITFELIIANIGLTFLLGIGFIVIAMIGSFLTGGFFDEHIESRYSIEKLEENDSTVIEVEFFEEIDYRLEQTESSVVLLESNGIFFEEYAIPLYWDEPDLFHFDIVRVNGMEYTIDEIPLRTTDLQSHNEDTETSSYSSTVNVYEKDDIKTISIDTYGNSYIDVYINTDGHIILGNNGDRNYGSALDYSSIEIDGEEYHIEDIPIKE